MRLLFLTNNNNTQPLIDWLRNIANEDVLVWNESLSKENIENLQADLVISYNYKFIIKKEILNFLPNKAINLHISLLPYNRGSNPNLWSFLEDTPKGVTIHFIDEGIDTGDILFQKEMSFEDDHETLSSSYDKLNKEIQTLFIENWETIKKLAFSPVPQPKFGSTHSMKDFKRIEKILEENGWDIKITELKRRYNKLQEDELNGNQNRS